MMSSKLCELLPKLDKPCVFSKILEINETTQTNECCHWTPERIARIFVGEKFTFRIGKKSSPHLATKIQFENECEHVEAEVADFIEWLENSNNTNSRSGKKPKMEPPNPFDEFAADEFWAYADYKYMLELLNKKCSLNPQCIDWSSLGFENRNAVHSTLWIGSEGAYTPCHFDTYGYNLVAQIYGKKRWTLFPRSDSANMYPTRVPFEESTVYSRVNIKCPDLNKYRLFKNTNPYVVDLKPGDVLYVPKNWWHFVENCETSISINTWVELEAEDNLSRLKEIISKTLVQGLMDSSMVEFDKWMNSSESFTSQEDNMTFLKTCLDAMNQRKATNDDDLERRKEDEKVKDVASIVEKHEKFVKFVSPISMDELLVASLSDMQQINQTSNSSSSSSKCDEPNVDYLVELANAATQPDVVDLIARNLLQNLSMRS